VFPEEFFDFGVALDALHTLEVEVGRDEDVGLARQLQVDDVGPGLVGEGSLDESDGPSATPDSSDTLQTASNTYGALPGVSAAERLYELTQFAI